MKLLVTGGAGYIGSHMVQSLLRHGHDVEILDNLEHGHSEATSGQPLHQVDLLDEEALNAVFADSRFEAVLHFAAYAYVGESVAQPLRYYRNNVVGTLNLVQAMRLHTVNALVFSSTCATYGVPAAVPITEATAQRPINPYGQSKLMVEQMLRDAAHAHGFRSIALRYFNAAGASADGSLGEGHDPETHLLPLILFEALRIRAGGDPDDTGLRVFGNDFDTPDGTCVRDYIHVEDLCSAHVSALQRLMAEPAAGFEAFNLGTNQGSTVVEAIQMCRQITGEDIRYQVAPRRDGDPPALVADASLAMHSLGWQPARPGLEDSVRHAWAWYLKHPPEPV